ncbi:AmmeMemoRadiSam system radical SAM enzyme [bacterium]|nr:AmmeMemoRadiSam system radical SAM enzyme [bacterium]
MREAILYKKLKDKTVQCQACAHYCVIANGQRGICHTRENQNGKLFNLTDNKIIACQIDPIEKKPFFHFLPGTYSLSIATMGCNFSCLNCQNWEISQGLKENNKVRGDEIMPEEIVRLALKSRVSSIAYTYTEPTIFLGYALETMKLAQKAGLKNVWVSNGYFTKETLKLIEPYLDAINIDLKFFDDNLYQKVCKARLQPVLDTLKLIKKTKIWLEVTTLVIPGYTDTKSQFRKIAQFVKKELGPDTPCHISKFFPCYKMLDVSPTPTKLIEQAVDIYKQEGLRYVYAGNLKINK